MAERYFIVEVIRLFSDDDFAHLKAHDFVEVLCEWAFEYGILSFRRLSPGPYVQAKSCSCLEYSIELSLGYCRYRAISGTSVSYMRDEQCLDQSGSGI